MEYTNDVWQVMVEGQIYEAPYGELIQWHTEGCFHPTDMVRKGNHPWIEACKVPQLRQIFSSAPLVMPIQQQPVPSFAASYQQPAHDVRAFQQPSQSANNFNPNAAIAAPPNAPVYGNAVGGSYNQQQHNQQMPPAPNVAYQPQQPDGSNQQHFQQHQFHPPQPQLQQPQHGWTAPPPPQTFVSDNCANHPHIPAKYICRACSALLCNDCPKKMGMTVYLCTLCGAMCEPYEQMRKKRETAFRKSQGFGFEDLGQAIMYPLKFPSSLIGGMLLYAIFSFGGIVGSLLAYMLIFGCMVVIIRQVAWGRMDRNFIADIGENGVLDDLIKPGFLGFGVTLVSFGPVILGVIIAIYLTLGAASDALRQRSLPQNQPQMIQLQADPGREAFEKARRDAAQREKQFESAQNEKELAETKQQSQIGSARNPFSTLLAAAVPLILLILVGTAWGFFYYPVALAIAGYTQDFLSVINPLVGIDTMKRMGSTYFKAFGMYIVIMIIQGAMGFIVGIVTIPFNTPFGNIPQNLLSGALTFYSSMVIACLLGLALFKCSDKLGIETD